MRAVAILCLLASSQFDREAIPILMTFVIVFIQALTTTSGNGRGKLAEEARQDIHCAVVSVTVRAKEDNIPRRALTVG